MVSGLSCVQRTPAAFIDILYFTVHLTVLSDSGNLYLLVRPNGSKLWRLDYSILGKRKTMALGSYPVIDLKTARTKKYP
ncbi:MAG TPA: DUF4102 domain-containing protein, partial [Desulfocapsa sulfexigens]|nr:DUF4102 domain-containing protein [Desulfocapsa sulfexigens]